MMKAEDVTEVYRMYEEDKKSLREIGAMFGVSHEAIRLNLLAHGHKLRRRGGPSGFRKDLDMKQMLSYYRDDKQMMSEIARQMGVSHNTVKARFVDAGVEYSRPSVVWRHVSEEKMIDLYNKGLSCAQIASEVGTTHQTVWRFLKDRVDMRGVGRAVKFTAPKELLKKQYEVDGMSLHAMAKLHGCSPRYLRTKMREMGIKIRSSKKVSKPKKGKTKKLSTSKVSRHSLS